MSNKVRVTTEHSLTNLTGQTLSPLVCPDMSLQGDALGERFITFITLVGSLTCVGVMVCLEVYQLTEAPTAAWIFALVWFARGVGQRVGVEVGELGEALVADLTFKRLFTSMD